VIFCENALLAARRFCARAISTRGGHSDKISCFVRPTAEPRSKIFRLSDRKPSRAELSDCPKIARLGSRLGSRALFRTNSDIGQPSSRDFWRFILSGQCFFFLFYLIIILVGLMTLSMSLTVSSDFRPQKIASSNL